jgi:hypothetical protein
MGTRYFFKTNVKNPVFDLNSKPVPFERLADNCGVLALDDSIPEQAALIAALEKTITLRIGGVVALNEAEYQAKKNDLNPATFPKPPPPFGGIRLANLDPFGVASPARAPAATGVDAVVAAEDSSHAPTVTAPGASPAVADAVPAPPAGKPRKVNLGRAPK